MGVQQVNKVINDNDIFSKKKSNVNESMSMKRGRRRKLCSDEEAENGANRLAKRLNAPECHKFFLKVMYHLPYTEREELLAASTRKGITSPKRYFTYSARKAMARLGY